MAIWYCGSVQWAAITAWAATTAYSVGDIRRQLAAPAAGGARAFRCTTAGTSGGSEPAWNVNSGGTTNDGTAVWTEVTGVSTYGWAAAGQNLALFIGGSGRAGPDDTVYVASNHAYSQSTGITYNNTGAGLGAPIKILCVNPAGSVPPVAADITTGGTETSTSGTITFGGSLTGNFFVQGMKFSSGASSAFNLAAVLTFVNCQFDSTSVSASANIALTFGSIVWENTQCLYAANTTSINPSNCLFFWRNTANPFPSTAPTEVFAGNGGGVYVTLQGLNLSGVSTRLSAGPPNPGNIFNFINCDLHASAVAVPAITAGGTYVNLIICDSGAVNYRQERHGPNCVLSTETTLVAGARSASDGTTDYSWKLITSASAKYVLPYETFMIAKWNDTVGSPVTCSVALMNDGTTLTNMDIWMVVEVLDDSGEPISAGYSSGTGNPLSAGTNIPTDAGAPWITTGIGSPVQQLMSVTFTPQMEGYLRAYVFCVRPSKTIYVNPVLELS